ncbi:regulatory iron-sulfur-containing complex subunit RicT [Mariniblastus sp.]|nr:regulatory iron-sulfur-containing complex subunit RicT [Mariniblastus sp.]MDA7911804.1 regulatory iron-sulfur-containing complex subunit RicT [bacterium]MDA7928452.1 regulatory iron-sulfur-containing complex subunit RicT [Mariniblastus sp.]MDC0294226.1 regulatory iron-sulfur-containing complex subunit RicT [Mariniblastus sp.]MDC3224151.1 regulatory iron-sulfur-containing complex subunit RicT [Mariniblastus sp.]
MPKYIVRYGIMRSIGVMASRNDIVYRRSMEVIVRTDRGIEVGQVLCEATDDALSHLDQPATGHVIREVSNDDVSSIDGIDGDRKKKLAICQKHIEALQLDMKLIDVEQLFGGERLIVFYLSEDRVDFRELVKLLASEFQTRIEMRQIGVRDEAKLLADYGDCGKPVCCNSHLIQMPPVSMKMAKLQKATLDPTKISGRCGRLKCCLRYEFDTYESIQKQLPRVGAHIVTRDGKGKVLNQQIISEQLLVEMEDHRRVVIDASDVLTVVKKSSSSSQSKTKPEVKEVPARESGKAGQKTKAESTEKNKNSKRNANGEGVADPKGGKPPRGKRRQRKRGGRNKKPQEGGGGEEK